MKPNVTLGVLLCLLSGSALWFAGCQGTVATSPPEPPLSASEMVGTWVGRMVWTAAGEPPGSVTIVLKADGTLSGSSSFGGALSGTWRVSGADYMDEVAVITRIAIFSRSGTVSGNTISGSFSGNAGSGTFEMTKR